MKLIDKLISFYYKTSSAKYINFLRKKGLSIGEDCFLYSPNTLYIDESALKYIKIGNKVQIAKGVIILGHDYSASVLAPVYYDLPLLQKETVIGNNVLLGMNSIILNGTLIGDNVIIGAGAVCKGIIESNSVYAGNPAKKICSLDEYYQKCSNNFLQSMTIYLKIKDNISIDNLGIYRKTLKNCDKKIQPMPTIKDYSTLDKIDFVMNKYNTFEDVNELKQYLEMNINE